MVLQALTLNTGYVCVPYMHNHDSVELKDVWSHSKNIKSLHFVTATFSEDSKPYFSSHANHYILAKYVDETKIKKDLEKFKQEKTSFLLSAEEDLFLRDITQEVNFVSVYYLEYGDSQEDVRDVAVQLAKRTQVGRAVKGQMSIYSKSKPKFAFPYNHNIIVLEVASEKSHQSVKKYCEKTRRDVCQKGIKMSNLFALSILDRLK